MKKFSIIIPCYNVAEYLPTCMEHLLQQTIGIENLEIILVDDASTDEGKTLACMMHYEKLYPDSVIVIPLSENMRQGGARNIGMRYASGEYLAFCDADDWFVKDAFDIIYKSAKTYDCDVVEFFNRDVTAFCSEYNQPILYQDKSMLLWNIPDVETRKEYLLLEESTLGCWNKVYRTSMIKEHRIQYADHVVWEEPSFTYMVRFYAKRHLLLPLVLHYALIRQGSTTNSSYDDKKFDNCFTHQFLFSTIQQHGLYPLYQEEVDFIFWKWYFASSLIFIARHDQFYTKKEFELLQINTQNSISDIRKNKYFHILLSEPFQVLGEYTYIPIDHIDLSSLCDFCKQIGC